MLIREQVDEMQRIKHRVVLAERTFVLSNEDGIDDDPDAIMEELDDRIPMGELRRDGVTVGLVGDLGEFVHLCERAPKRPRVAIVKTPPPFRT
jgi:hypothetical protein